MYQQIKQIIKIFIFTQIVMCNSVRGKNLIDVIPSLYGGDGVTLLSEGAFPHDAHFTADSLVKLAELATATSEISLPIPSSQGGFTFDFDPVLNEFVQSTNSLGPIFSERAETLGKGKMNFGFTYTYVNFDEFEGDDLDDIQVRLTHIDIGNVGDNHPCLPPPAPEGACYAFERDAVLLDLDIELESHVFSFFGTYGLGKNFDVGFLLPVIYNEVKAKSVASIDNDPSGPILRRRHRCPYV